MTDEEQPKASVEFRLKRPVATLPIRNTVAEYAVTYRKNHDTDLFAVARQRGVVLEKKDTQE